MKDPRVRALLLFLLAITFGVLLFGGYLIDRQKPPIAASVVSDTGATVYTREDVKNGQKLYLSRGGQDMGTIWGHGSYLAPDWSADYLHRAGLYVGARLSGLSPSAAAAFRQPDLDSMDPVKKAELQALAAREIKTNRFDAGKDVLTFSSAEAESFAQLESYYTALFRDGNERMGLERGIVKTDAEGHQLTAFFSWLAWAAGTNRPGQQITYTSNWPYDPLVGNQPVPGALIWSIASVIILIFFLGIVIFLYARYMREEDYKPAALVTRLAEPTPTGSQKATLAYFITAMALFVLQIVLGSLTAHYTVEGGSFFGLPIEKILPYAAVRTWHLQLAIFWIATCFLAAGLFIGPFVGKEPRGQGPLTVVLFVAVVLVVLGSLAGTWLSVMGRFGANGFLFGHQGYEYIELGRVWQLLLIVGMIIWLVLVVRAIRSALLQEKDRGGLTHVLLYSAVTIPLFYMAGLMYGQTSDLSDAEYWRWWVVHLWVEGFFEVFATVVLAFILARIGAVSAEFSLKVVYVSIFLYLGAGVIGTFHHLYWTGTPTPIIALGAVFSALEIVPLALLGFETAQNMRTIKLGGENYPYKWPLYYFVAVAFWNVVGAGVFGFLINPPIVLYYGQGLNTTPLHAHTALFGVYGVLAIALMLFSVRHIVSLRAWSDGLLKWAFWLINGGLAGMAVLSLAPSGFYQLYYGVKYGIWYARSPEIASGPVIKFFNYTRVLPDVVFGIGGLLIFFFIVRATWMTFSRKAAAAIPGPRNVKAGR
ncbi:MAG TPA: nitric-oxide reductase large subunit [Spirochaetia bacterium]|nr:nitric-oxide reductase large subunit [Spirochaetia bacterium]